MPIGLVARLASRLPSKHSFLIIKHKYYQLVVKDFVQMNRLINRYRDARPQLNFIDKGTQ